MSNTEYYLAADGEENPFAGLSVSEGLGSEETGNIVISIHDLHDGPRSIEVNAEQLARLLVGRSPSFSEAVGNIVSSMMLGVIEGDITI